ncbi:MAG: hypothetical protein N838_25170 [Thiohalocapsa sp. PB-PSB1]|nr:MAG: hypothetical protein N838_25170 [Thiohalocapsa sp. PB-PSB1]
MLDVSAQKEASSNFHAKYLLAREIGQHFTRLAVLVAVFSKDAILMTPRPALAYARILRQPALHKLLFWVTPFFLSGNTMSVLKSAHTTSLRKISRDIDQLLFETVAECAKTYSDALDILHEPDMREHLNQESANILNWRSDPDLKLFNNQVSIIAQSLQKLGKILGNIFLLADEKRVFRRPYAESGLQVAMKNFQDGVKSSLN